ncbi:MAG: hypothetical protein HY863_15600 [Chloroflexi bacterium]|nr:hypothetical protein [Chloroflexota bacterium]
MSIGSIPESIELIINAEVERINKEQSEKEEREKVDYQQRLERGRAYIKAYVDRELEFVPEYLREFYHHLNQSNRDADELAHLYGRENESQDVNLDLVFYIPGLAPIVYDVYNESLGCFTAHRNNETDCAVWGDWRNAYRLRDCVETVLVIAKEEFDKYQTIQSEYDLRVEKRRERELEEQRRDYERSVMDDAIEEVEEMENEVLFEAIKDDQVAIFMLKAFVGIQQERKHFEQRIDGAE